MDINKYIHHLSILVNIILYFVMFAVGTFIANLLISIVERLHILKKILNINYTKGYRRNTAKGFNIE